MRGSSLKTEISNTSWGSLMGNPSCASFAYKPVPLDLKSGIPSDVEMPAPVMRMMLLQRLMRSTASLTVL